jgi:hypothetical protein
MSQLLLSVYLTVSTGFILPTLAIDQNQSPWDKVVAYVYEDTALTDVAVQFDDLDICAAKSSSSQSLDLDAHLITHRVERGLLLRPMLDTVQ